MQRRSTTIFFLGTFCLAGLMLSALSMAAQQAPPSSVNQEQLTTLLDRIHSLEIEVQQLKEKSAVAAAPAPPAPEPEASPSGPGPLQMIVFGDVGYQASDDRGTTHSFQVGSFDLFMTSRLSDKVSAIGELVLTAGTDNVIETDLERILLQYKPSKYFGFGLGRYHTNIGYYNATFHHGQWLQTPIGRPLMYAFDDESGFLPMQEIGVTAGGILPSGKLNLHWIGEMGNGRSHLLDAEPAQNKTDSNNDKSFNLGLYAKPSWVRGLQTGFSFYRDVVKLDIGPQVTETIPAVYVVYINAKYEWLNEGLVVSNTPLGGRTFHTPGFYSQITRALGKYKPYFRYAYENANVNDPLFAGEGGAANVSRQSDASLGLRYDVTEGAAFKLQYDHIEERDEPRENRIATQFAFTF
jgi:hypothetical protein